MNAADRKLDALLVVAVQDLIDKELEEARSIDTTDVQISERAQRRIRRKIKSYGRESWWAGLPMVCRRTVAAFLIACTVAFGLCLSVEAVRAEIVSTVLEWYDKFVAVFFMAEKEPLEYIEEYKEPTLQPAGTEKQVVMQTEKCYRIVYMVGDNVGGSYQQMVISDESIDIDSEHECIRKTGKVNGCDAVLLEYANGKKNITWHDNEYTYLISSFTDDIDFNTLLYLAESVK